MVFKGLTAKVEPMFNTQRIGYCEAAMSKAAITLLTPSHIGDFAREILEGHALNVTMGAKVLGVSRQALSNLVNRHGDCRPT